MVTMRPPGLGVISVIYENFMIVNEVILVNQDYSHFHVNFK